jgi:hypothetical protein
MEKLSILRKARIGVLVASVIFSGCKDNDGGGRSNFTRMNIEEAKTLFIASSNSVSKMYGIKNSSLKSTSEDEEVYEINCLDENNNPIEEKIPSYIHDAGKWLVVIFDVRQGYEAYFVKKTDGSVYKIPDEYFPSKNENNDLFFNHNINIWRFRHTNQIRDMDFMYFGYDNDNNIYYPITRCPSTFGVCPRILYKVSSITSATINFKQISDDNDNVGSYCIDDNGNIVYGSGSEQMRYCSANGDLGEPVPTIVRYNHGAPIEIYRFIWAGTDGIMSLKEEYREQLPDGTFVTSPGRRYLMKMENGKFVKKREITFDFDHFYPSSFNVFYVHGKVIYSHYDESTATLIDISSENSYRETPCSVEANIVINDELYNFDKDIFSLTHINIDNGAITPVFTLDKSVLSDYIIQLSGVI